MLVPKTTIQNNSIYDTLWGNRTNGQRAAIIVALTLLAAIGTGVTLGALGNHNFTWMTSTAGDFFVLGWVAVGVCIPLTFWAILKWCNSEKRVKEANKIAEGFTTPQKIFLASVFCTAVALAILYNYCTPFQEGMDNVGKFMWDTAPASFSGGALVALILGRMIARLFEKKEDSIANSEDLPAHLLNPKRPLSADILNRFRPGENDIKRDFVHKQDHPSSGLEQGSLVSTPSLEAPSGKIKERSSQEDQAALVDAIHAQHQVRETLAHEERSASLGLDVASASHQDEHDHALPGLEDGPSASRLSLGEQDGRTEQKPSEAQVHAQIANPEPVQGDLPSQERTVVEVLNSISEAPLSFKKKKKEE